MVKPQQGRLVVGNRASGRTGLAPFTRRGEGRLTCGAWRLRAPGGQAVCEAGGLLCSALLGSWAPLEPRAARTPPHPELPALGSGPHWTLRRWGAASPAWEASWRPAPRSCVWGPRLGTCTGGLCERFR